MRSQTMPLLREKEMSSRFTDSYRRLSFSAWKIWRQRVFEATVKLVNSAFPKQINARPLLDRWHECQKYIQHALTLAEIFHKHHSSRVPIQTLPELGELLKNCVWYIELTYFIAID